MLIKYLCLVGNMIFWVVVVIWGSFYVLMKMVINVQMLVGMINGWWGLIVVSFVGLIFFKKLCYMSVYDVYVGIVVGIINYIVFQCGMIGFFYIILVNNVFLIVIYVVMVFFLVWLGY